MVNKNHHSPSKKKETPQVDIKQKPKKHKSKKKRSFKTWMLSAFCVFTLLCLVSIDMVIKTHIRSDRANTSNHKPITTYSPSPTPTSFPTTAPTIPSSKTFINRTSQFSIELPPCQVTETQSSFGYSEVISLASQSNKNKPLATIYVTNGSNTQENQKKITSNYQIIGRKEITEIENPAYTGIMEKFVSTDQLLPQRTVASLTNGEITVIIDGYPALVSQITNQITFH